MSHYTNLLILKGYFRSLSWTNTAPIPILQSLNVPTQIKSSFSNKQKLRGRTYRLLSFHWLVSFFFFFKVRNVGQKCKFSVKGIIMYCQERPGTKMCSSLIITNFNCLNLYLCSFKLHAFHAVVVKICACWAIHVMDLQGRCSHLAPVSSRFPSACLVYFLSKKDTVKNTLFTNSEIIDEAGTNPRMLMVMPSFTWFMWFFPCIIQKARCSSVM